MVFAAALTWVIQWFILSLLVYCFYRACPLFWLSFHGPIGEMFLHKTSPALYRAMGIFLPLITNKLRHFRFCYYGCAELLQLH